MNIQHNNFNELDEEFNSNRETTKELDGHLFFDDEDLINTLTEFGEWE